MIDNMKEALSSIKDHHWINQSKCGTARQYLEELLTSKSVKKVNNQAIAVIQPLVTHIVLQHYKALTYFKVGAICLPGVNIQYNLMGSLHCDYHGNVNKKCQANVLNPFSWLWIRSSYFMSQIWVVED